jgi:hypothetical protein
MIERQLPLTRPPSPSGEARHLLAELRRRGVVLRLEGGAVRLRSPRSGAMGTSDVLAVKRCSPKLARLLAEEAPDGGHR